MTCPLCRVFVVSVVALTDIIVYVYDVYIKHPDDEATPISYPAHISGAVTGLLVGIIILRNLQWEKWERIIWAVSFLIFVCLMLVAIIWNFTDPDHFTGSQIPVPCISDKVL